MRTIFLSPHFDDIALSCGGLVWQKSQAGEQVSIWTICAGEIPAGPLSEFAIKLHTRWQTGGQAVEQRRIEDIASCNVLGADYRHFSVPDCIYRFTETNQMAGEQSVIIRRHLYSEETFLGPIHPAEETLIEHLASLLKKQLPEEAVLVSPLAIGGHVDHRLVRRVAELTGRQLLYYADYPYCVQSPQDVARLTQNNWERISYRLSEAALHAWQDSIAAHTSQISTFWSDLAGMTQAITKYYESNQGVTMWKMPKEL